MRVLPSGLVVLQLWIVIFLPACRGKSPQVAGYKSPQVAGYMHCQVLALKYAAAAS
ncbi:hypothetical protein GCM10010433_61800 [Streptomyces pulveraceus]